MCYDDSFVALMKIIQSLSKLAQNATVLQSVQLHSAAVILMYSELPSP